MAVVVTAKQLRKLLKKRFKQDREILLAAALEACQRGVAEAVRLTNEAGVVDRGFYKRGFRAKRLSNGAEMVNAVPHAGVIEFGRRPGRPGPPLAPILAWVRRKMGDDFRGEFKAAKGLAATMAPRGRRGAVKRAFGSQTKAVDARIIHVAHLIRAKIHRDGTKPHGIVRRTLPVMGRTFRSEVRRRLSAKR